MKPKTTIKFRNDMNAWEVHYISPNKQRRQNSITVSLNDYSEDKARLIAEFLYFRAKQLEDDPTIPTPKSSKRITTPSANDTIMQNARKAIIKFLGNFK